MATRTPPKAQAGEVSYELHTLGWKAFQQLSNTIVSAVWGQTVQSFSDSHDGGRDGAFYGTWLQNAGELYEGPFTLQCKFKAKANAHIRLSDLGDELDKAASLAKRGLATNYFLFTNAGLSGNSDAEIRSAFEGILGVDRYAGFGCERISQIIRESPKLRMLVPRVYGLGDLSQILDERAYGQAESILSSLGDDLGKFVITDAYQKSAKALSEHNFVLLLGEPTCGKSTIAAALALGALDLWKCSSIKIRNADDFVERWNPYEPNQFFWVDDAFGITQFDSSSVSDWNRSFSHVNTAIKKGARVLFTSRDYIYRSARNYLKETAIPVIKESQVVINVEDMTKEEREQVLYNHIRLGTQSKEFRSQIKPFLRGVAAHARFMPEIARRLGDPGFTKNLVLSQGGLDNFVEKPMELLCETIRTLDDESQSALALVFMRAGELESPIEMTEGESRELSRMGGSIGGIISALHALDGSFVSRVTQGGHYIWRFRHPTIRDAFAMLVAENNELMDIYLTGTPLERMFREVSCGDVGIEGVKVIVSVDRYEAVIARIQSLDLMNWRNELAVHRFLAYRCNREFLVQFIAHFPKFIDSLHVSSYLNSVSDVGVIVRLHEFELLPESKRLAEVNKMRELAVDTPDSGFLRKDIRRLFTDQEFSEILDHVSTELLPNLNEYIGDWESNFDSELDPEEYFNDLSSALENYRTEFGNNEDLVAQISVGLKRIVHVVDDLRSELPRRWDTDEFFDEDRREGVKDELHSVFEDVDS